jgi:murein endopeptidase
MMYSKCDGCGKEVKSTSNGITWFKPNSWYEMTPKETNIPLQACSRECIEIIDKKRKSEGLESNNIVIPI